jgi:tetraacyldisaccharide 4'-kinase
MKYLRWLLFPVSLVYGLVVTIRNWFYNWGLFKSRGFDLPIISVGNLDVGGAGKTPMTEYLIRLLKPDYQLATLSRGYGRDTRGFYIATTDSPASEVGDEPAQLKHKFPEVNVSVCEDRVAGAEQLQAANNIIILDDAYQHRAIKPGYSLLLFDYQQLNDVNMLLPAGNRRELFGGRKRADVIIVTKCPINLDSVKQGQTKQRVAPYPHQQVFFTGIAYQGIKDKNGNDADINLGADTTVFLLTGIANSAPMYKHIALSGAKIIHHNYPDHHRFSLKNITKLADDVKACISNKKIIITTEKDMQRLQEQELLPLTATLPIYTLPIGVEFLSDSGAQFNLLIQNYVRQYTAHRAIH